MNYIRVDGLRRTRLAASSSPHATAFLGFLPLLVGFVEGRSVGSNFKSTTGIGCIALVRPRAEVCELQFTSTQPVCRIHPTIRAIFYQRRCPDDQV